MTEQVNQTTQLKSESNHLGDLIVHAPLPLHSQPFNAGIPLLLLAGLAAGIVLTEPTRPISDWWIPTTIIVSITVLIVFIVHYAKSSERFDGVDAHVAGRFDVHHIRAGGSAIKDLVHRSEMTRSAFGWWGYGMWSWQTFEKERQAMDVNRPRTIIDTSVAERLAAIDLPDDLLEPEPILPSVPQTRPQMLLVGAFLSILSLVWLSSGHYLLVGFVAVMFGMFAIAQRPRVRDALRIMRYDDGRLVAGPGFLESWRGQRWTIDNAVMVVQVTSTRGPLYVHLVGPAGHRLLTFSDEHDHDFIKLWQRWNHPRPRPELVGD